MIDRDTAIRKMNLIMDMPRDLVADMNSAGLPFPVAHGHSSNSNCFKIEETNYDGPNLTWYASEYCEY